MDSCYLEPVASDELEWQLTELPEVVPRELALLIVEGEGLGGHDPVRGGALVLQPEHVLLHLRVAEGLVDAAAVGAEEVVRHVGVEVENVVVADEVPRLGLVLQKVASELHPKVRNHGEGPY